MDLDFDFCIKTIILGDAGTGKTSILKVASNDRFNILYVVIFSYLVALLTSLPVFYFIKDFFNCNKAGFRKF